MSSRIERDALHGRFRPEGPVIVDAHFEVEDVADMKKGLWFPLSSVLDDLYSPVLTPRSSEMFPVVRDVIEAFGGQEVNMRGSTWIYKLLNANNIERRGTLSTALRTGMKATLEAFSDTESAAALSKLENFSDFDLFLPGVGISEFDEASAQISQNIDQKLKRRQPFNRSNNPNRIKTKRKVKIGNRNKPVLIEKQEGKVEGEIPYIEAIVKSGSDKLLSTVFLTPGDLSEAPLVKDTRRDPRYALSWDSAAVGTVKKQVPDEVREDLKTVESFLDLVYAPGYRRTTNANGVFLPSAYSSIDDDIWFNIPQENLRALCLPIEVGSYFQELSAVDQFKLALRAVQKGVYGQENLNLTPEGRKVNTSTNPAPALSPDAIDAFWRINLDQFKEEYSQMGEEEKSEFRQYVMENMMTGLFYPQRFLRYMDTTRLLRFFPQLDKISDPDIERIILRLPDHETYSRRQYVATHFFEEPDSDMGEIERARNFNSLENPYHSVFEAIVNTDFRYLPNVDNAFEALDVLLSIDEQDYTPKDNPDVRQVLTGMGKYVGWEEDALIAKMNEKYEELDKNSLLRLDPKTTIALSTLSSIASIITNVTGPELVSTATWIGSIAVVVPYLLRVAVHGINGALGPLDEIIEIQRSIKHEDQDIENKFTPKG